MRFCSHSKWCTYLYLCFSMNKSFKSTLSILTFNSINATCFLMFPFLDWRHVISSIHGNFIGKWIYWMGHQHFWVIRSLFCIVFFFAFCSICLSSTLVHYKNSPDWDCSGVFRSDEFSRSSRQFFCYFFFHLCLFDDFHSQYFLVLAIFLFSKRSNSFLIRQFYFFSVLFPFYYEHGAFFYVKFHFYILVLYSCCLYQNL